MKFVLFVSRPEKYICTKLFKLEYSVHLSPVNCLFVFYSGHVLYCTHKTTVNRLLKRYLQENDITIRKVTTSRLRRFCTLAVNAMGNSYILISLS